VKGYRNIFLPKNLHFQKKNRNFAAGFRICENQKKKTQTSVKHAISDLKNLVYDENNPINGTLLP